MSWETPAWTPLILSVIGFCLLRPQTYLQKALYALSCAFVLVLDPRRQLYILYTGSREALLNFRLHDLLTKHFKMVLTLGAIAWLFHRSWQTLWKPVPELVNILGVDIPLPPDVSLAGIRPDAATLSWTRPPSNRPVQRYSIQVNGVHVGESPGNEIAITVTGLKPNHFYNIRVVAVGPNNFQAGSPVIRLRTFGKDGRPQLGNSRLPTSFTDNDQPRRGSADNSDDSDTPAHSLPSVEAAPVLDGTSLSSRDMNIATLGQRRNTLNRRHSPSVASSDRPQLRQSNLSDPELTLSELHEKFESIRKETEDTLSLYAKDEADSQKQDEELKREKERKRQTLKEKEEQTAQLKALIRTTMEQMRSAEKERLRKEQQLKDKDTKKSKLRDNIAKVELEAVRMKKERDAFNSQKLSLGQKRDLDSQNLATENSELQEKCSELEAELKDKGKQLQDLKATRETLPGADDEQWQVEDARLGQEWDLKRKDIHSRLVTELKQAHQLEQQLRSFNEQFGLPPPHVGMPFYQPAASTPLDYDHSLQAQPRRQSLHSTSLSPPNVPSPGQIPPADLTYSTVPGPGFSHTPFASGFFMNLTPNTTEGPQTEAEFRATGGPLSPSAQTLLPSNIFDEMEDYDAHGRAGIPPPEHVAGGDRDPQSPASSARSINVFTSPHGSSNNLTFPHYQDGVDSQPTNINHSVNASPAPAHRFTSLLQTFQRSRNPKSPDDGGPPIGSLKSGQSQSFPRATEEIEVLENRRKLNFSWMNRNSTGLDGTSLFSSRRLNSLRNSNGPGGFPEVGQESSRPASIASTDLPRPSTDSGSIWGAPGEGASQRRPWPGEGRWPSRSGSRRPSIQGSSTCALTTTLASADDDILDEAELLDPQTSPSQVGVIGSRPPANARSMAQRLNPNAPTFMANIFRKDKDRSKEKSREERGKGKESSTPSIEFTPSFDDSPTDRRISRDTFSVHTQNSIAESHESLILDAAVSNTASDINPQASSALKEQDNKVRKLFRKGSSSKFSLSSRLGKDSGIFKKGPGSTANSDKNLSADQRSRSSIDVDDMGEDVMQLGRSYDSMASSPSLGPAKSKDSRESRISSWRFSMKKKGKDSSVKGKESLDLDRTTDEE